MPFCHLVAWAAPLAARLAGKPWSRQLHAVTAQIGLPRGARCVVGFGECPSASFMANAGCKMRIASRQAAEYVFVDVQCAFSPLLLSVRPVCAAHLYRTYGPSCHKQLWCMAWYIFLCSGTMLRGWVHNVVALRGSPSDITQHTTQVVID